MLFHSLVHLAKNTVLEEKPSPSSRHFPVGKKEVISLLRGSFKGENKATDISPFKTICASGDSEYLQILSLLMIIFT